MSRVAKAPVAIPAGVEVKLNGQEVTVKGAKGELSRVLNDAVVIAQEENNLTFGPKEGVANAWAQAGTARALVNNMVVGVTEGFTKKLTLKGVGYRAAIKGKAVALTLASLTLLSTNFQKVSKQSVQAKLKSLSLVVTSN
ncbi:LSU ribosomal protein L6p [Vibrio astriarenae]|nr:LSU ribosomal protein L6p [Vibrio sp. C7]